MGAAFLGAAGRNFYVIARSQTNAFFDARRATDNARFRPCAAFRQTTRHAACHVSTKLAGHGLRTSCTSHFARCSAAILRCAPAGLISSLRPRFLTRPAPASMPQARAIFSFPCLYADIEACTMVDDAMPIFPHRSWSMAEGRLRSISSASQSTMMMHLASRRQDDAPRLGHRHHRRISKASARLLFDYDLPGRIINKNGITPHDDIAAILTKEVPFIINNNI